MLALQLYDDERDAAWWFGIAAAAAGLIGTPLGGRLADMVLIRYGGGDQGDSANSISPTAPGVMDDSVRWPFIASMISRINVLVACSLLAVFPTLAMQEAAFFLTFLFIGWTLLFMTQTGINLVAMMSVDRCHRPNALAALMLTSHLLGDVPLPIILGLIKDTLAPACTIGPDGEFTDAEQCKEQEVGIRQTLAIAYSWVIWSLIFFEVARRFARREISKSRSAEVNTLLLQEEESSNGDSASRPFFGYYHSKFQPPPKNTPSSGKEDVPEQVLV